MKLCTEDGCTNKHLARGLCSTHYNRFSKAGTLPDLQPKPDWHRLSDKNLEHKTATCSICGPVRIYLNRGYWICKTVKARHWASHKYHYGNAQRIPVSEARDARKRLAESQQSMCAICGLEASDGDRQLALDHCHDSGDIRGLLCGPCNTGLGMFKDNPHLLERAAEYLR